MLLTFFSQINKTIFEFSKKKVKFNNQSNVKINCMPKLNVKSAHMQFKKFRNIIKDFQILNKKMYYYLLISYFFEK